MSAKKNGFSIQKITKFVLVALCFVFVACDDAVEQPHTEQKEQQEEDRRKNFAYTAGVRMYVVEDDFVPVSPLPFTTYQEWKERIELAREEGRVTKSSSGVEHFDYERMQGVMLPKDKAPTANGEPVYFACSKRMIPESKIGGKCRTRYVLKDRFHIWYPQPEWTFYEGDYLLDMDAQLRIHVEDYLQAHPEFYYNRLGIKRPVKNHAYLKSGVQMFFHEKDVVFSRPPTTYQEWKDRIELARKEGRVTRLPSGMEHFDYERMQGLMLPKDKAPTANGEPVYFACAKWKVPGIKWQNPRPSSPGGNCSTTYYLKNQLRIHHRHAEKYLDNPQYIFDRDTEYRQQIEDYLQAHPEFYYNRIERGE